MVDKDEKGEGRVRLLAIFESVVVGENVIEQRNVHTVSGANAARVPAQAVNSRILAQLLLRGGRHYVPLKKDFAAPATEFDEKGANRVSANEHGLKHLIKCGIRAQQAQRSEHKQLQGNGGLT